MNVPRINQIEAFGRAVDEGLVSRDEATDLLAEASGGRLTRLGAADLLADWKGARTRYDKGFDDTARALDRLRFDDGGAS